MMLIESYIDKNGKIIDRNKVKIAIDRLKAFEPDEGYYLAFSGGKDSVVIKELANMAGVKYDAHYSLTTVDPPELVRFIFDQHPDVMIERPKLSMWKLIEKAGSPPLRNSRYCCSELKECDGKGRLVITGVRWSESVRRKARRNLVNISDTNGRPSGIVYNDENDESRRMVEQCYRTQKTLINPIIDWTDAEVWQFIREKGVLYCELYDQGYHRLGCIGCPMNTKRLLDFDRWPTYKIAYIRAFDKMLKKRCEKGMIMPDNYRTGEECFVWWTTGGAEKQYDGQIEIEEE